MTKKISNPEKALKSIILELITDLKKRVFNKNNDEKDDMFKVHFFFQSMDADRISRHVVREIIPHETQIRERDEDFFIGNRVLFADLPEDRVDYYMDILMHSDRICKEDKVKTWDYFDTILALALICKKNK